MNYSRQEFGPQIFVILPFCHLATPKNYLGRSSFALFCYRQFRYFVISYKNGKRAEMQMYR